MGRRSDVRDHAVGVLLGGKIDAVPESRTIVPTNGPCAENSSI